MAKDRIEIGSIHAHYEGAFKAVRDIDEELAALVRDWEHKARAFTETGKELDAIAANAVAEELAKLHDSFRKKAV